MFKNIRIGLFTQNWNTVLLYYINFLIYCSIWIKWSTSLLTFQPCEGGREGPSMHSALRPFWTFRIPRKTSRSKTLWLQTGVHEMGQMSRPTVTKEDEICSLIKLFCFKEYFTFQLMNNMAMGNCGLRRRYLTVINLDKKNQANSLD